MVLAFFELIHQRHRYFRHTFSVPIEPVIFLNSENFTMRLLFSLYFWLLIVSCIFVLSLIILEMVCLLGCFCNWIFLLLNLLTQVASHDHLFLKFVSTLRVIPVCASCSNYLDSLAYFRVVLLLLISNNWCSCYTVYIYLATIHMFALAVWHFLLSIIIYRMCGGSNLQYTRWKNLVYSVPVMGGIIVL